MRRSSNATRRNNSCDTIEAGVTSEYMYAAFLKVTQPNAAGWTCDCCNFAALFWNRSIQAFAFDALCRVAVLRYRVAHLVRCVGQWELPFIVVGADIFSIAI